MSQESAESTFGWTGERLIPSVQGRVYYEHIHRYAIALEICRGKSVLDIACGEGYGANLMATAATHVTGVDIDEGAIAHARKAYPAANIDFKVGDCLKIPLEDNSVQMVVSFETIEHITRHAEFILEVKRVLSTDGLLLISSPDRVNYNASRNEPNEFHKKELLHQEFVDLLSHHFRNVNSAAQEIIAGSVILPVGGSEPDEFKIGMFSGNTTQTYFDPHASTAIYSIALCSNGSLPTLPVGAFSNPSDSNIIWHKAESQESISLNYETEINRLIEEIDSLGKEHALTTKDLDEKRSWAISLNEQLEFIKNETGQNAQTVARQSQRIEELTRELGKLNIEHALTTRDLDEKRSWALSLDKELNAVRAQAAKYVSLEQQYSQLEQTLSQRLKTIEELTQALDEIHGCHNQLIKEFEEKSAWALQLMTEQQRTSADLKRMHYRYESELFQRRYLERKFIQRFGDLLALPFRAICRPLQPWLKIYNNAKGLSLETPKLRGLTRVDSSLLITGIFHRPGYAYPTELRARVGKAKWPLKIEPEQHENGYFRFRCEVRMGKGVKLVCLEERIPGKNIYRILTSFPVHVALAADSQNTIVRVTEEMEQAPSPDKDLPAEPDIPDLIDAESIQLPESKNPVVSIVIPIHNQLEYTLACLNSITSGTGDHDYEVIIGNDSSSERTMGALKSIPNLKVFDNPGKQGFLHNCNYAASHAHGDYIFFLNNDTIVEDNWLEPLLDTFKERADAGIVGSKLVYPDGSLQEAGGIIWQDGSGWNYGRNDEPDKPEYNYLRKADYISGAALMIKRELFERLNGFDEHFSPAYYEDTDLAFRVRRAGFEVYYQPQSVVIHYEGKSCGTDTAGDGHKRYQLVNAEKFFARWQDDLQSFHYPNAENVFRARERSRSQGVVVVIDHYVPHYDQDAGSKSTWQYILLFVKLGYSVKFIGDNFYPHQPYTQLLQQHGIEVLHGNWYYHNIHEWLREHASEIDLIFTNRSHITIKYLGTFRQMPDTRVLYYGHDLGSLRNARKYELTNSPEDMENSKTEAELEMRIWNVVDVIFYPSAIETDYVLDKCPLVSAYTLPLNIYTPLPNYYTDTINQRHDIVFVGGFNHPPNEDAILWFLDQCWPDIENALPEAHFFCVGSKPTDAVKERQSSRVEVTGWVSDEELEKIYQRARIVVIPLRYGAGVKGKVIEAALHHIPSVITPVAAEGIPNIDTCVIIENPDEGFVKALIGLYRDKDRLLELSNASEAIIRDNYTEERALEIIKKSLQSTFNLKDECS